MSQPRKYLNLIFRGDLIATSTTYSRIRVTSDDTTIVLDVVDRSGYSGLCKYTWGATSINCFTHSEFVGEVKAWEMVSDTEYFVTSLENTGSSTHGRFMKMTWGNTTPNWVMDIGCSSSPCSMFKGATALTSDKSTAYTMVPYGSGTVTLLFIGIQMSDGSLVGSKYLSDTASTFVYDVYIVGTKVYALSRTGSRATLSAFDTATSTFQTYRAISGDFHFYGFLKSGSDAP